MPTYQQDERRRSTENRSEWRFQSQHDRKYMRQLDEHLSRH